MRKIIAKLLLFTLLFNLFPSFGGINNVSANDTDGTANLNLTLNSNIDAISIIGDNFVYNFSLKNENDSEATAYKNGFILNLPKDDIDFISSSDLGSPTRIVINGSRKLLFFQTDDFLLTGSTNGYNVTLKSLNSANLLQNYELSILAYADDSIYGRGAVPDGAPAGTLSGGVDLANSVNDPSDLSFPDNIDENTDLSTLPFISNQTKFIPFDIEKTGEGVGLIGHTHINTITIRGNSLGDLKNFSIKDVIPNNRKFVGFTQTGGISNISVVYNSPNFGETTLYMSGINVSVGTDLEIKYETLSLAFPISSYSGTNIILNTGSVIADRTPSENKVIQLQEGTWNNGSSDIAVDSTTLVPQRSHIEHLGYAKISKSVTGPMGVIDGVQQAVIGDLLTYTINLNVARNVAFNTNGSGTYLTDIVPDGLSFSGVISSVNNGVGNALTFVSSNTDANGDTTLLWKLDSGEIKADDDLVIVYQAVVDGLYEGSGDTEFENTETLTNSVTFLGTISDSQNNEEWGYTDSSLIDSTVSYTTSSSVKAPDPTNKKYIVKITTPDATVYDNTTGLPSNIPVGSEIQYALVMAFPNVNFLNAKVIDALPLIVGPNDEVYDYAFQTDINLKDINGTLIEINDDDNDGSADSVFNGKDLTSTGWISETPANNVEFDLGSGSGNRTFSILFKVKVLDIKPDSNSSGLAPLKNVSFASVNDDQATINNLEIQDVELDLGVPELTLTKTISGSNIEAGSFIDYKVEINNIGKQTAYIEDLIDTLPDNLTLDSYLITGSGFTVSSSSLTQSGNNLTISFDESNGRSTLPANSSVKIEYRVKAGTGLLINDSNKTNTISLDYFATDNGASDGLHNYGPLEAETSFVTKQPTIVKTLISTSETGSTTNNLEIGEDATFETIITLPGGSYDNSSFLDYTSFGDFNFITGSVVSSSGDLSFSTGTGFTSNTIDFGNIVNSNTDDSTNETIVIHSTYRGDTGISAGAKSTMSRIFYNATLKTSLYINVYITEPSIVLSKSVTPIIGDAGDTASYTITMQNNGNANAYDLKLKDILDSRFSFKNGTLVKDGFVGTEDDFKSNTGIVLDVLNIGDSKTITFDIEVNQTINPDDIIPNTTNLDYSSLDADNSVNEKNYTAQASENYRVSDIVIVHNLINTSNNDTDNSKNSALEDLAIGEHVFYKTVLSIPEATFSGTEVTQTLPTGFKFLTGSLVFSGGITSSLSNIVINPDNTITYTLGEITNSAGNGTNVIELFSELIVTDSPLIIDGSNKGLSTARVEWNGGHSDSVTTNLDIVEPNIVINKSVNPLIAAGGDTVTYTISLNNNGNGPAYDLKLNDILNEDFELKSGTLNKDGFSGSEDDFKSNTGIILDALLAGESKTISFDILVKDTVTPNEVINNVSNISYSSAPEDNLPEERSYSGSSNVNLTIGDISVSHEIISTNNSDTSSGKFNTSLQDLAIGEEATYKTIITFPNSTSTGVTFTQSLPEGFKFLTGSIDSNSLNHSLSNITINPDNTITINLGDVSNDGSGTNTIIIYTTISPIDDNNISAGQENGLSNAVVSLGNGHTRSANINLDTVEPNLVVSKQYSIVSGNGGDTATTTITITNNGTAPAYDISWNDTQSSKFTNDANYLASSGSTILNVGDSITYQYNLTLKDSVIDGETLTGGLNVDYTSSPGVNSLERAYNSTSSDNINVIIDGDVQSTLDTTANVKIGDESSYTIKVKIGEGTTNTLKIEDLFPTGIAVDTGSIVVTKDVGITYSGSNAPTITSTGMTWNLSNVINSNSDDAVDDFIIINFNTVLLNTSNTNIGDTKTHNVKAIFNGTDEKNSSPNNIIVIEPSISLNISNTFDQVNDRVKYVFTLTNTGTASAYDLDLETLLANGVSYTGAINITNSGGAINLLKNGDDFTIRELPVNSGNPLTFEIYADVSENHILGETLTLTGNLVYTSQDGSYTQVISGNSDNTERNGDGGIDDYKTSDNTSFEYKNAILDETISVVDDNGGDNLANEIYTYTVTLTNTGNVDLTDIPVSIEIPEYLSGATFVLQSIPGGANSNYDVNGGTNNNGKLDVTGVNITIGNSVAIVYKIKSNKNISDLTTINTIANVGNSTENAIGGNPNIEINIKAPILSSTSEIIDDNGGNLFLDEIITNNTSFTNSGSVPAINSRVVLTYNTGTVEYISGSLDFGTGVLVNTGTIVINENAGTISFIVTELDPNKTASITFKTKVVGNVGTKTKTTITVNEEKGYSTETTSNEFEVIQKILELNEEIEVLDNNGGNHLGGETYTYTVTLTNSGNIDLTGIDTTIEIPEYLSGATFVLQSIPAGANSNFVQTGGLNSNGKLDVTGISIPMGESRTIVYKIDSDAGTPDGTHIDTRAIVTDAVEGATGGNPNVEIIIDSPTLQVSSEETDDNGVYLYLNDEITHINKIKNNGSYSASNMDVVLTYDTATVDYIVGSLQFSTGSNVDNNSIIIDEAAGTISFTLTSIDSAEENIITFKTKANGNVGDTVKTNISANDHNGHQAQTDSNILKIESAILDETISVVDDNGGENLGDEFYTYTVTLTNNGTVDLTQIPVSIDIPNYLNSATFNLITTGLTSTFSATGGVNNNGLLTITGVSVPVGTSKTIVYKIKSKALTPDSTTINTISRIGNTPELATGGTPNVEINIKAPILTSTSEIIDENEGNLYIGETVINNFKITNSGSTSALNNTIVLTYNTGTVEYISGSLDFGTGVLVDNNSIVINETAGTITFIITKIDSNQDANITFKTKVIGEVGGKVQSNLSLNENRGFTNNTDSEELIIARKSGGGSRYVRKMDDCSDNGGDFSGNYYDGKCGVNPNKKQEETKNDETKDSKIEEKKDDKKQEDKNFYKKIDISKLRLEYERLLEKQKRLEELLKQQIPAQGFVLPKILPKTGTPIEKRTFRRNIKSIDVELPNKDIFRLAGKNNVDINFWKQVLPKIDQNKNEYVIIPSNGLVIPVNKVPENTADFNKMISGKEIHVNDYLKTGAMEYPNSGELGKPGNKVIFGHSSYWKTDDGRYKTHFGKIIELDVGEEIWVYKKINGEFKRFKYKVSKSYNTKPTDVGVLKATKNSSLTLFTCTPIGGIAGRWIIKANYIDETSNFLEKNKLQTELYGLNIKSKYRFAIDKLVRKIGNIKDKKKKGQVLLNLIGRIEELNKKYKNNEKVLNILNYLKMKLLFEIFGK